LKSILVIADHLPTVNATAIFMAERERRETMKRKALQKLLAYE
jgi:hypothetical protein